MNLSKKEKRIVLITSIPKMMIFLFSFLNMAFYDDIESYILDQIHNKIRVSTVSLKNVENGSFGSGFIVLKNNKKYILTNNHVCDKKRTDKNEEWVINSFSESPETFFVKNSNKYNNESYDICFMEYMGTFPAYDLDRKARIFKIADYFINDKKTMIHYTRNRTYYDMLVRNKVVFGKYLETLKFKSSNDNITTKKKTYILTKAKIVAGDSGSVIFNKVGELKGQVFAQQIKTYEFVNTKGEKELKKRDYPWLRYEEEEEVLNGYATKADLIMNELNKI